MTEIIFDENEDWDKRILCSDESCIGIIGPDGKCKECGKPYEGKLLAEPVADDVHTVAAEEPQQVLADAETDDWDKRVLCSDGSCIGIIGPDGKCKECGKPYNYK
ncbi:MAG: hypothetical protein APR62_00015 [Smithella sp. SDB]|nr:MAG: hypothetical protein APR62_00015 [Smithella sp. SDB]